MLPACKVVHFYGLLFLEYMVMLLLLFLSLSMLLYGWCAFCAFPGPRIPLYIIACMYCASCAKKTVVLWRLEDL